MRKLILIAFASLLLSVFSAAAFGQRATRITFKKGARSATVSGYLTGYKSHQIFVIRVRRGQTLTTENAGKNYITVRIVAPPGATYEQDMAADCHDRNKVSPTSAGDYKITVVECAKADRWRGMFKLKVSVR